MYGDYLCPDCGSCTNAHDPQCSYNQASHADVEKEYTDTISRLNQ
ncbi:DUF7474 family protein [Halorientalis salina]